MLIWLSLLPLWLLSYPKNDANTTSAKIKKGMSDEELGLMYKVFVYKSELDEAYRVAKLALQHYPEEMVWHQRLAEVAQWTGRSKDAIEEWFYIYKHNPSKKLRKKLIDLSMEFFQYEKAMPLVLEQMKEEPSKKNIDDFVYVWEEAGRPEEVVKELYALYQRHPKLLYALEQALRLSIALGDQQGTQKLVEEIARQKVESDQIKREVAYYFYTQHRLPKAYRTLLQVKGKMRQSAEYLRQISDLGWYLGDRKRAADSSMLLYKMGKAELRDYDRIILESKRYPTVALEVAKHVWESSDTPSAFYTYAYLALEGKRYEALLGEARAIESDPNRFQMFANDPLFWMIVAETYRHVGDMKMALAALKRARALNPGDAEIETAILWLYIDMNDAKALKSYLFTLEREKRVREALWFPMAAGWFSLQEVDRAKAYLAKVLEKHPDKIDVSFLYAYILQNEDEPQAAMQQFIKIHDKLEKSVQHNPALMHDGEFLDRYLRSAMMVVNPDRFVRMLKRAKPYLHKKQYADLALLWSMRNNANEMARMQLRKFNSKEPWIALSSALHFYNTDRMLALLYRHYLQLPLGDRVDAAKKTGDLSFGYTLAYEGMEQNEKSSTLYEQFREFTLERADRLSVEPSWYRRDAVVQKSLKLEGKNYLHDGIWLKSMFLFSQNQIADHDTIAWVPHSDTDFSLALEKEFDRGRVSLKGGYRESLESYFYAGAELFWQWSRRLGMTLKGGYANRAEETTYLMLGGKKDYGSIELSYALLPSTTLSLVAEFDRFSGQDDLYLGKGEHLQLNIQRNIRLGYPDMHVTLFAEFGRYDEEHTNEGEMARFNPYPDTPLALLPEDFDNYGVTFGYGMQNSDIYIGVWRPFFEITPFYNRQLGQTNFSCNAGIGGSIYHQDHLIFGIDYNQAVNGTQEQFLKIYFNYQLLY